MTIDEVFRNGIKILIENGVLKKKATRDARCLLMNILHLDEAKFIKCKKNEISISDSNNYISILNEYIKGKPLEYITHNAVFFGYSFFVNEATLIPRIDSEIIVEFAIKYVKDNKHIFSKKCQNEEKVKILDICSGSGCLGLSFVKTVLDKKIISNNIQLTLIDISPSAMQVAKINAQRLLKLENRVKINYLISDILINGIGNEKYDIILCNPPYIESNEIQRLDKSVKDFEPRLALDGGEDGLKFYKSISVNLNKNLSDKSMAFFEIGYNQGNSVEKIFTLNNFAVELKKDYGINDRCLIIRNIYGKNT